jgi:hypothetical protein
LVLPIAVMLLIVGIAHRWYCLWLVLPVASIAHRWH